MTIIRSGRLLKQGDNLKTWRERYVVLSSDSLEYWLPECIAPGVGSDSVEGGHLGALLPGSTSKGVFRVVDIHEVKRVASDKLAFCLVLKERGGAALLRGGQAGPSSASPSTDKEILLQAPSERERDGWMKAIAKAIYSPGQRVAALVEATAMLKRGALCIREWELVRALIAGGTDASLAGALGVMRRGGSLKPRGSEALESLLVDLALAYSEGALLGALAGLRRVCSREVLKAPVQERLVEQAISKYGTGAWLNEEAAAVAGGYYSAAEEQDGIEACVSQLARGLQPPILTFSTDLLRASLPPSSPLLSSAAAGGAAAAPPGGSGGASAGTFSSPSTSTLNAPPKMKLVPAEWTTDCQEAFGLVLHAVAACVARARVQRRGAKLAASAATAAASASASADVNEPSPSSTLGGEVGGGGGAAATPSSSAATAGAVGTAEATVVVPPSSLSPRKRAASSVGGGRSRAASGALDSLFARAELLGDISLAQAVKAMDDQLGGGRGRGGGGGGGEGGGGIDDDDFDEEYDAWDDDLEDEGEEEEGGG